MLLTSKLYYCSNLLGVNLMKNCLSCGKEIKTFQKIDGKIRNLQNRKYCLECSPFGEHNTKMLNGNKRVKKVGKENSLGTCISCGRESIYVRQSGDSIGKCNSCWTTEKRRNQKLRFIKYLGSECKICG